MEKIKSARLISPGRIIKREIEARGWTQLDLAEIMDRPAQAISEIIRGKKQITTETALQLANVFGTSPELWMNLEVNYRLGVAKQFSQDEDIIRKSNLYSKFPVREIINRGWIDHTDDINELEEQFLSLLNLDSMTSLQALNVSFRKSTTKNINKFSCEAWISRVKQISNTQDVPKFNKEQIIERLNELLGLSKDVNDIEKVPKWLNENGVKFVVLKHLRGTYLDGALIMGFENPIIAMTLRYDRIDNFWFTLIHEIAHLIKGHGTVLDDLENPEINTEESEANEWAANVLIDQDKLDRFSKEQTPYFRKKDIEEYSERNNAHPGVIVGQLHKKNIIPYRNMREYLVKVSPFLEKAISI